LFCVQQGLVESEWPCDSRNLANAANAANAATIDLLESTRSVELDQVFAEQIADYVGGGIGRTPSEEGGDRLEVVAAGE
jgi:hypothetical protein